MSGFKQKWATNSRRRDNMLFGGVSAFLYELYKLFIFPSLKAEQQKWMKKQTKNTSCERTAKKAAKASQKACGINFGTKSEGSGINFVPKNAACFLPKAGVEVERFQNPMHYIRWYLGWRSIFLVGPKIILSIYDCWEVELPKKSTTILGLKKLVYQPQKIFPLLMDSKKARIETLTP